MDYQQYKANKQAEFNALPIFYAFSNKQFKEAMEARGLTENDTDKVYRLGRTGGFYLKTDAPAVKAYFDKSANDTELATLMREREFAVAAFRYEMDNHEYAINYQGDWDVCNCFAKHELEFGEDKTYGDYLAEAGMADLIPYFEEAHRAHRKAAEEWI